MTEDEHEERLKRARELRDRAARDHNDDESTRPVFAQRVRASGWFQWSAATLSVLRRWLGPVGSLLAWVFGQAGRWYRWAALKPAADGGGFAAGQFVRRLLLSGIAAALLLVGFRALYFYGTAFEETVYVTGKQEIETGELYQFGGCTSLPCSTDTDNGKFFLLEASLILPTMLYPEENVFANIPHQDAACQVRGYGIYFRSMRWIYKSLQLYQHVIDVSCRPYTEEEIRRAVAGGEIVRELPGDTE